MEPTQNNQQAAVSAPETNLADLSLADYRAMRDGSAAKDKAPKAGSETPAEADEQRSSADESASGDEGADDSTEDASEKENSAGEKPAKKEGGFQKKIRQRDERIAELERKLAEANSAPAAKSDDKKAENPGSPKTPAEPQFAKPKPKLEDFESLETFTEALTDWKAEERDFRKLAEERRSEIEKSNRTVLDNFKAKEAKAKEVHPDYDAVLKTAESIQIPAPITRTIIESDHGPEIAYYLAQHQDELKAIAKMHPLKAAVAIGKLETKFDGAAAASEADEDRSTSTAPAPPKHVNSGRAAVKPNLASVSLADYRKMRESGKVA